MTENRNAKIIAFVGLAGSGKTAAGDYIVAKGYPKVNFGKIIWNALDAADLEHSEKNAKIIREVVRQKNGKDYLVKQIIPEVHNLINSGQRHIIVDGIYSWTEYKAMKSEFPGELTVVAIVAPRKVRHRRLLTRPVHPYSQFEADQRDWAEIENLEKGGPIAIADHYIMNDGSLEELHAKVDQLLNKIEFL